MESGSAEGIVFNDTITLGGLVIQNQAVEAAVEVDPDIFSSPDFPLTVSWASVPLPCPIRLHRVMPLQFFKIYSATVSNIPRTLYLRRRSPVPLNSEGFFTFGSIDDELVGNNTIIYTPVIKSVVFLASPFSIYIRQWQKNRAARKRGHYRHRNDVHSSIRRFAPHHLRTARRHIQYHPSDPGFFLPISPTHSCPQLSYQLIITRLHWRRGILSSSK